MNKREQLRRKSASSSQLDRTENTTWNQVLIFADTERPQSVSSAQLSIIKPGKITEQKHDVGSWKWIRRTTGDVEPGPNKRRRETDRDNITVYKPTETYT